MVEVLALLASISSQVATGQLHFAAQRCRELQPRCWPRGSWAGVISTAATCLPSCPGAEFCFQTSLILGNRWLSMKSFQLDTPTIQSSSRSCAIPSSLFWNLCCFFWYTEGVSQMCPFHKGNRPAHARHSAVFTCVSFAVSEILTVQFHSDSPLLTAVEMH